MRKMLFFEVKKVFSKPINKAALIILMAVLVVGSFLTIRDVKYTTEDGTTISGIAAARYLKEEKNQWAGDLTEDVLVDVIQENQAVKSTSEAQSENERVTDIAYAKTQGISDIKQIITLAFGDFDDYDYYLADRISTDEVGELYERRIESLKEYLYSDEITDTYSEAEKEFLISQYENLDTPFYYEYTDGWKALMDSQYMPTLMMILVLVAGFFVAGIFSDEFSLKADSIFFSSRLGRNKAVISKIGAGVVIVSVIYWAVMLLYSVIVLGALGFDGGVCWIQTGVSNWRSFYNITYFQDWALTLIGGYVGSLFILTLAMFISAKTHSTVLAITIPFILTCVPPFLGKIAMLSRIMVLFPDQLLRLNKSLEDFSLYQIGGKIFGAMSIIIPLYLILFCIIIPILYLVYRRTQIK